jgi:hypothetical protein
MSFTSRLCGSLAVIVTMIGAPPASSQVLADAGTAADEQAARSLTAGQHAAASAGHDNPGTLRLSTRFDRPDMAYRQGDAVRLIIETSEDAYVTVVDVGPSGRTIQLFPNAYQTDNLVKANAPVEIPPAASAARIVVNAPFGAELVKVVASSKPMTVVPPDQLEGRGAFRSLTGGADALIHHVDAATASGTGDRVAIVNRVIRTSERAGP